METTQATNFPFRSNRFVSDVVIPSLFLNLGPLGGLEAEQIRQRRDITHREKNILVACLMTRKVYKHNATRMSCEKAIIVAQVKSEAERAREFALKSMRPSAILFRLMQGDMAATTFDFAAKEEITRTRQELELAQHARRCEITDFACKQEEKYRAKLAAIGSPAAKRLFNEISVTGRTITHFKQHELVAKASQKSAISLV